MQVVSANVLALSYKSYNARHQLVRVYKSLGYLEIKMLQPTPKMYLYVSFEFQHVIDTRTVMFNCFIYMFKC